MPYMIVLTVAEQPSTITATAQYITVTRLTVTQPKCKQPGWRLWRCASSEKLILFNLKLCLAHQFCPNAVNHEFEHWCTHFGVWYQRAATRSCRSLKKKNSFIGLLSDFFRNELLTYGEKYNRKSKTIEAFCTLCISTSAANGRKITGHDSDGFIRLRKKLKLK